ncbi:MAG: imidazolonepropionase [Oligoflexus sp.]
MDHHNLSPQALLIENIGELITMAPLAHKRLRRGSIEVDDLGIIHKAWLLLDQGKIQALGSGPTPVNLAAEQRIDAKSRLVSPGLVDCHTHPIFGGDRSDEFAMRLDGKSYQDIAAQGGGIRSTIAKTRAASDDELQQRCLQHCKNFLAHGVTTVEAKSGYGQSPAEELRLLRILNQLKSQTDQHLSVTCLALHARPKEYPDQTQFIQAMIDELLPTVAKEGLAEWVDAFVEDGYFSVEDCEAYMQAARRLGLKIRIHADEFKDSHAAAAAARWQAHSADHLEEATVEGLAAMSQQGSIAVLLPGTSLYTRLSFVQAKKMREQRCLMAIATDFNPGSCHIDNLPMLASVAAVHCGLTVAETIAAITFIPALALDLEQSKGALAPGWDADLIIHDLERKEQWLADFGRTPPSAVFIQGRQQKMEKA